MRSVAVSCNIFVLLLLALFNSGGFTEADDISYPNYIESSCNTTGNFRSSSPYQFTLTTLLFNLPSEVSNSNNKAFYNTSSSVETSGDSIYVLFWCRGDIPTQLCQDCVEDASKRILSECPNNKEAIIWYEECSLRYSDLYFFSTLSEWPRTYIYAVPEGSNSERKVIEKTLNDALEEAAAAKSKFATKEAKLNSKETLYSLAECTPDLSYQDCRNCLLHVISWFNQSNHLANGGEFFLPTCNLRCYTILFYYKGNTKPLRTGLFSSKIGSNNYYLNFSCSTTKNFTVNSAYEMNLKKFLSSLVLSSNNGNMGFNNTKVVGKDPTHTVYGLFMCRGDVSPQYCHQCVGNASQTLSSECRFSKEAIIWYDQCFLRYSNHSFFSTVDTSPKYILEGYYNNITQNQQYLFNQLLAALLTKVVAKATKLGANNFATEEEDNEWQNLYTLAQCTPDLSNQDCGSCLKKIEQDLLSCCLGKEGGLVLYPSCNLRFETYRFYSKSNTSVVQAPMPPPTPLVSTLSKTGKGRVRYRSRTIITLVVVFVVVALIFFSLAFYLLRRKKRKNKAILKENFGSESATLESLQFNLATIEAATNKFSHANKIGKGGFGEVYKGVLHDGREIAVKRLSKRSGQGAIEFKNEILLIAKLQHRNLVALLGFCLEDQEKMLVYEFVSNKSLDYFLFGSQRNRVLNWPERYKIIEGIAHGILYLHEHSRLKVIHRDLKPSNILLDDDMNPKISDFGMARMIAITESEGSTTRIVGTYGYMAPEYAMLGQFSEKSDIFSFGVIVLEIICGKRNVNCRQSQHADGLLSYVWKQWREERWSEILDSNLQELESHSEVMNKCIHIGLLCVQENPNARPSMVTVVQYLSNDLIQLPFPQEPAFFIHGGMESIRELESGSGQHTNESIPCSANQLSITELHPR